VKPEGSVAAKVSGVTSDKRMQTKGIVIVWVKALTIDGYNFMTLFKCGLVS
jgi:hypothetical protein